MVIRTMDASSSVSAEAELTFNGKAEGQVKIAVAPWHPQKGEETIVATATVSGDKIIVPFEGNFTPWSPDTPVLYSVRAIYVDANGTEQDDLAEEYGFRTITQKDGAFVLNGKRILMNGALRWTMRDL
jgi:beta-galactosidase/beta-glucuronidase